MFHGLPHLRKDRLEPPFELVQFHEALEELKRSDRISGNALDIRGNLLTVCQVLGLESGFMVFLRPPDQLRSRITRCGKDCEEAR